GLDVRTTRRDVAPLAAMRAAKERDSIAREYVTDFEITFTIGAPTLERYMRESGDPEASTIQTYLTLLSKIPDSLIARKCGERTARTISGQAAAVLRAGGAFGRQGRRRLARWDATLRGEGNRLNPGTTADLTAAALFLVMLEEGVEFMLGKAHTSF
ncbi:MAG: triphosphoribosyl-dephospho-CoA synthase, partial [Candidatus Methylomirabilaceae bacterium]